MSNKHLLKKIISSVLSALMLSSVWLMPMSAAAESNNYAAPMGAVDVFDYSSGTGSTVALNAYDIFYRSMGISIGAEEADYLSSLGFSLKYSEGLSSALISTFPEEDHLLVSAKTKSYIAANGESVLWVPSTITVDGVKYPFDLEDSVYSVTLSSLLKNKLYNATVEYRMQLRIKSSDLSPWLNRAYNDAKLAIAAQEAYEQAKREYDTANQNYQNALEDYETELISYQKYIQELKKYNAELADYNEYLSKVTAYEAALELYNEYLKALEQYDSDYSEYEKALSEFNIRQESYNKYLKYLAEYQILTKKLTTLNSAFIKDSVGHRLYSTLMGDTVATVMEKKDELVNMAGASAADIENAGAATDTLQDLLTAYSKISDTREKLYWYKDNYKTLKDNFILLYSSLDNLGKNRAVQIKLNSEGKWERYAQFVGQLYIISTGLDDDETFDSAWTFANTFHIYYLIEECQRVVDDNSASPEGDVIPDEVKPVEKPALPKAPTKPASVTEPVKTWDVDLQSPGDAPKEVYEPKVPVKSDFVPDMPHAPQISASVEALIKLVRDGALSERSITHEDKQIAFTCDFDVPVFFENHPSVTFYDHEGKKILYSIQLDEGGTAVYSGPIPTRESDAEFHYSFIGWADKNGDPAKLSDIYESTAVYASYSKTVREYKVTWNIAGQKFSEIYTYGQMPSHTADEVFTDSEHIYYFNGWYPEIAKVTGPVEYTAQYTKTAFKDITYSISFKVGDKIYPKSVAHGEIPKFDDFDKDYFEGGYRFVFTGWSSNPVPAYSDAEYTAQFEKLLVLPAGPKGDIAADMTVTSTTHTVFTDETVVDAAYAVKEAMDAGTQLVIKLGGAKITISNAALLKMPSAARFSVMPKTAEQRSGLSPVCWEFKITDKNGNTVQPGAEVLLELPLFLSNTSTGTLAAFLNGKPCALTVQNDTVYVRLSSCGTIEFLTYYTVDVETSGNGHIVLPKESFTAGEKVSLPIQLENGWALKKLIYSVNGGAETELALENGVFLMPDGNVSIRAEFIELEYTVVFMVNGVAVSTEKYHYGDSVKEPNMADMLVIVDGDRTYTFSGWDQALSLVTDDKTYTAVYKEGSVAHKDTTYVSEHNSDKLFTIVLPIVLTVITLGIAALVVWRICRRKKH